MIKNILVISRNYIRPIVTPYTPYTPTKLVVGSCLEIRWNVNECKRWHSNYSIENIRIYTEVLSEFYLIQLPPKIALYYI